MSQTLYDSDYGHWLEQQIVLLKSQRWQDLDIPHLIEELEGLNRSSKRELYSYLVVLLAHLLKWQYQPSLRSGSWHGSIQNSRRRIDRLFKDQPSLRNYLPEILEEAYREAVEWAGIETKLDLRLFAVVCPFSLPQILDIDFLPS